MAIVVEDGTGTPGANSYVDVVALRDYAGLRGVVLPDDDTACEVLLIKAMDFLESKKYIGRPTSDTQSLSWPRKCAITTDGLEFDTDEIPAMLKKAQCQAAIESMSYSLMPSAAAGTKGAVMSESVYGAVSRTYAQPSTATSLIPYTPLLTSLISSLLRGQAPIVAIRT